MLTLRMLVIERYEKKDAHSIALGYLAIANQSYIEYKRFKHEKGLYEGNLDAFDEYYIHFKHEFSEVVVDDDSNHSYMMSRFDQLADVWEKANEFLENQMRIIIGLKR